MFYVQMWKFIYIIIHSGWSLVWIFMKERVKGGFCAHGISTILLCTGSYIFSCKTQQIYSCLHNKFIDWAQSVHTNGNQDGHQNGSWLWICSSGHSNLTIYHLISSKFYIWITFIKLLPKFEYGLILSEENITIFFLNSRFWGYRVLGLAFHRKLALKS